jgi:tRNA1Val (adenine37-N6)-methyltransferase
LHAAGNYDLIISNPPYFIGAHPAPSEARNIARHMNETLSIEELASCVKTLLSAKGIFCVILPYMEGIMFKGFAESQGLYAIHLTKVKTKIEKQEKRLMMKFSLMPAPLTEDELVIQEEDLSFTEQYVQLTKDFYLGLPKKR